MASKAWKPADELNFILTQKEQYVLLIQRPGQSIRHYGKHFHCVITAIDPILNPTGLSLSIGRRDKYTKDHSLYCSASKQRLYTSFKEAILEAEYNKRRQKKNGKRIRTSAEEDAKKKGGFQKGNIYARSSVVRILFN